MARNAGTVEIRLVFSNPKAVNALVRIQELAEELSEDYPWIDDLKELRRAAKQLQRNTDFVQPEKHR